MTSHVIGSLRPFTSYSVSMTSIDVNGIEGPRSPQNPPSVTGEAGTLISIIIIIINPLYHTPSLFHNST